MQRKILFPIDQPVMPEARQIGRRPTIERLERKLDSPSHVWLIGERRIGKTSVAKAVLARSRESRSVALDIDLSRPGLESAPALAGEIASQAQTAGAGTESTARKIGRFGKGSHRQLKGVGEALKDFGFDDVGSALEGVSALLAGGDEGAPGLDPTLRALAIHAHATGRRVWLLLDEVHHLAGLDGAERIVAYWCRREESPLIFLFAGSEESAARELREPGRPLTAIGADFELAEIAFDDWVPGLRSRFAAALLPILQASGCHPRRTMMIAARVNEAASLQPDRGADGTLVKLAIREAERDRSWT